MEYTNLHFGIIGIVGFLAWSLSFFNVGKKPQFYLPQTYLLKKRNFSRLLIFIIGIVGWLSISFSLMGPRKPIGQSKSDIEVNDIFFVVDVSRSMLAIDFPPNRLEVAKRKIIEFVDLRPRDRIGVIIFSENSFTLVPLTNDLALIKEMVGEIKTGFLGPGTNIGDALGLAIGRGRKSLAKNKVIILLTDGVSITGNMTPLQAAKLAAKEKIKVYTVGIGGEKNAKIPTGKTIYGHQRYQNIPGGGLDEKTLKEIASITGAQSFIANNEKALETVLSEIEKLERTKIKGESKILYEELYLKWLILGVLLFLLSEVLRRFHLKEAM